MTHASDKDAVSYALFKDGKQISKAHSMRMVCVIEAFEKGFVVAGYKDFISDPGPHRQVCLVNGVEIREVKP